jgi:hypothetical protein
MSDLDNNDIAVYKKKRLPTWLKAILIKAWFAGAVYFFIGWGLFINTTDQLDITLAIGLVLGIITDVVVNRIFRGMERGRLEYHRFMMFPKKKITSFFLNVLYAIILAFIVAYTYNIINYAAIKLNNLPETSIVLGAEPILFGVFYTAYDLLFLQIKKAVVRTRSKDGENKENKTKEKDE